MKTFKFINDNTQIILNNEELYTLPIDNDYSEKKWLNINGKTYFYQGQIIIE